MSQRKIERYIKKWVPILGIEHYKIKHCFMPAYRADATETEADTAANWQYLTATIRYYLPMFADRDDEEIEQIVLHELVHVLVAPMESVCPDDKADQRELAVEQVTRALLKSRGT